MKLSLATILDMIRLLSGIEATHTAHARFKLAHGLELALDARLILPGTEESANGSGRGASSFSGRDTANGSGRESANGTGRGVWSFSGRESASGSGREAEE